MTGIIFQRTAVLAALAALAPEATSATRVSCEGSQAVIAQVQSETSLLLPRRAVALGQYRLSDFRPPKPTTAFTTSEPLVLMNKAPLSDRMLTSNGAAGLSGGAGAARGNASGAAGGAYALAGRGASVGAGSLRPLGDDGDRAPNDPRPGGDGRGRPVLVVQGGQIGSTQERPANANAISVGSEVVLKVLAPAYDTDVGKLVLNGLSPHDGCDTALSNKFGIAEERHETFTAAAVVAIDSWPTKVQASSPAKTLATNVVANCYKVLSPADFTQPGSFLARHELGRRLGVVQFKDGGLCTALLVGDGQHIVTARHCFFDSTAHSSLDPKVLDALYFKPVLDTRSFQLCAISERDALNTGHLAYIGDDQVVVRIAPGLAAPAPLVVADAKSLRTVEGVAKKKLTDLTALASYTFMPSAKALYPESTGFVVGKNDPCAAVDDNKACFSNVCRAVGGASGAPVFDVSNKDAPALYLLGTHNGSGGTAWQDCKIGAGLNVAVFITDKVRALIAPPSPKDVEVNP